MGEGVLTKDFQLSPGPWTDDHAEAIETFMNDVVGTHVTVRSGYYVGTGKAATVPLSDFPGSPKVLWIQPANGGTLVTTLVAVPGAVVTAWNKSGFTVSGDPSVNAQTVSYRYVAMG